MAKLTKSKSRLAMTRPANGNGHAHFEEVAHDRLPVLQNAAGQHRERRALKRFQAEKRPILLAAPQRRILAGLRITHLDTLFRIYDTLDQALAALAKESDKEPTGEHKRVN